MFEIKTFPLLTVEIVTDFFMPVKWFEERVLA